MPDVLLIPGDGVGPEVVREAVETLKFLNECYDLKIEFDEALAGGNAYDRTGTPLPDETLDKAKKADAVLLGAVGGLKWDGLPYEVRPERALLGLRKELGLYANLRPAVVFEPLLDASALKPEVLRGSDIMVVRELVGGIYFGTPKGVTTGDDGVKRGVNTLVYTEPEIERIARVAFKLAEKRRHLVHSVDKANVLESMELWRVTVSKVAEEFPHVTLRHLYVDNCAMQLVQDPRQFDVIVTGNMFGDILSDEAAMITGSIGMLPSASLGDGAGLFEPVHGSAPDIAGKNIANPIATLLSVSMMLKYGLDREDAATTIDTAVQRVLDDGFRTADIARRKEATIGTREMGDKIRAAMKEVK